MRITVEVKRPARRSVAILLALVLLAVPGVALASHMFNDVPTGHPFHTEISAIAGAGITAGFPDGGYHPADNVTRQAMAAFLERGLGHIVHVGETLGDPSINIGPGDDSSFDLIVKQLTVTIPGAANSFAPQQLVYVHGRVELIGAMGTAGAGCPCEFGATIRDVDGNLFSNTSGMTFESSTSNVGSYSMVVDTLLALPPGARTLQLIVTLGDRVNTSSGASWSISPTSTMTVMTFPFSAEVVAE